MNFNMRGHRMAIVALIMLVALSTIWLSRDLIPLGAAKARLQGYKDMLTGKTNGGPFKDAPNLIAPKIWQIMLAKKGTNPNDPVDTKVISDSVSWLSLNRDYQFTLMGSQGADEFLNRYYANEPEIINVFHDLVNVGMKSDFLRYLLLATEGGVYTDTDTSAIRPISEWVPEEYRDKARVVIGIEWDQQNRGAVKTIPHIVQFCQWTIAAAEGGHPVFKRMTKRILASVKELEKKHGKPLAQIEPEYFDVLNTTGPASWTDAVFEQLQEYNSSLTSTKDFSYLDEPRLVGDMLILTINGFGMGQRHSGSVHDGSIPGLALTSHKFRGSWKDEKQT